MIATGGGLEVLHVAVNVTVCPEVAGFGTADSVQSGAVALATWTVSVTGTAQVNELELHPVSVYCAELPGAVGATTWMLDVWMLPGFQL